MSTKCFQGISGQGVMRRGFNSCRHQSFPFKATEGACRDCHHSGHSDKRNLPDPLIFSGVGFRDPVSAKKKSVIVTERRPQMRWKREANYYTSPCGL